MGIVNTSRSIFQKAAGFGASSPEPQDEMPEQAEPDDIGPDEVEEDERDREGNIDPGTNAPPLEDPDAAEVRKAALQQAADDIAAAALAQAKIDAEPRATKVGAVHVQSFKYLTIGADKGMFHITATDSFGTPFTHTGDAPPNLTVAGIVEYLSGIAAIK